MTDRRRSPFDEFEQLFERLNREFGEELGRGGGRIAVDVEETDDSYVVTADLPGFEKEDVDVELHDETLHISAEREAEREEEVEPGASEEAAEEEEETQRYLVRERHAGAVSRAITLPETVDEEGVTATFENGVLRVELPKAAGEKSSSIEIQ
ncbi:Hsp20/alpha crystallin family protein [Halospeciosus flavus]|uniref:Hsp20/alpha crystallin family protein n=1 Tax=Halospeciosus flavus TaxID=3032283 RepID=A0ABD5Z801_9EURY|nr:Hsp20 family protein [Halospeciosus flavus]